jgi:hypothetical protein
MVNSLCPLPSVVKSPSRIGLHWPAATPPGLTAFLRPETPGAAPGANGWHPSGMKAALQLPPSGLPLRVLRALRVSFAPFSPSHRIPENAHTERTEYTEGGGDRGIPERTHAERQRRKGGRRFPLGAFRTLRLGVLSEAGVRLLGCFGRCGFWPHAKTPRREGRHGRVTTSATTRKLPLRSEKNSPKLG